MGWTFWLNSIFSSIWTRQISFELFVWLKFSCGMILCTLYRDPPDFQLFDPTLIVMLRDSLYLKCWIFEKKENLFIKILKLIEKKTLTTYFFVKQWAAVRTNLFVIIEHPHSCNPFIWIEHWYGAIPSSAIVPPTIRPGNSRLIFKWRKNELTSFHSPS